MPELDIDSSNFCVIGKNLCIQEEFNKTFIGYFSVIHDNVSIGKNSTIGSYCELEEGTIVGNNCVLQGRVRTGPKVVIEDDVVIKYGTILTDTALVKRNVFIGPNVITLGGGHDRKRVNGTVIGNNCYIGAGTKIAGGVEICDDVVTGANSFINKDITEPGIYAGTPARKIK
jgi:UDP-3-O-[3-hydroxymyristoyl] glucosamine N-acyltransferase